MQDGLVSVCLTDTNGDDDIHLNDCLVKEGFAIMQQDDYEVGWHSHLICAV